MITWAGSSGKSYNSIGKWNLHACQNQFQAFCFWRRGSRAGGMSPKKIIAVCGKTGRGHVWKNSAGDWAAINHIWAGNVSFLPDACADFHDVNFLTDPPSLWVLGVINQTRTLGRWAHLCAICVASSSRPRVISLSYPSQFHNEVSLASSSWVTRLIWA